MSNVDAEWNREFPKEQVPTTSAIADELEQLLKSVKENGDYKYQTMINQMMVKQTTYIEIDYSDLGQDIQQKLMDNPDEMLEAFDTAVYNILKEYQHDYSQEKEVKDKVKVRISNYVLKKGIREINTDVINKLITVSGMVVRTSEVKPLAKKLVYYCVGCEAEAEAYLKGLEINKPVQCAGCQGKKFNLLPEKSEFVDFQFVRIQELPEDLPAGQLPHYVEVIVKGNLVDESRPGDRVLLTGMIRIEQDTRVDGIFHLKMEGNNIEYLGGLDSKADDLAIDTEDERKIIEISQNPDAYYRLISSFAPNIFGHDVIKESILLLIVGSVARKTARSRIGDINLFLIGDPGTGKSELLKFAANIAPRGIYTSGRGTTAAGLTAAVIKDKAEMMVLEAGACVLGDQGLCCIDEFDKIKDEDRSALHEIMEQQTCSVAKGGIVATLNARTSILAAGNPQGGKYDTGKSVAENIYPIPIPLLTRFDVIHIVRDVLNAEHDQKVTNHILRDMESEARGVIDIDLLRKYLSYTKRKEPTLSTNAVNLLGSYYMKMRSVDTDGMITVTPRQLEGLVRLATARARLLLKETVEEEDAQRAIDLVAKSLETIGINVETGQVTIEKKQNKQDILSQVFAKTNEVSETFMYETLMNSGKFTDIEAKQYIAKALKDGYIWEQKRGFYKRT